MFGASEESSERERARNTDTNIPRAAQRGTLTHGAVSSETHSLSSLIITKRKMTAAHPTPTEVVSVALVSAACHSALDMVPNTSVQRLLSACGAMGSDGFDFRMWVHSFVMGVGAAAFVAHETATEAVVEPERSVLCLPPSSFAAWALPAAELGYALHDLRDALHTGKASFILHGVFVGGFLALTFALGVAHHSTFVLTVHASSVFLNMRRIDFGPRGNAAVDAAFAISFLVLRLLMLPALWALFLYHCWFGSDSSKWGPCMLGGHVIPIAAVGGLILHGLNFYWGWLIVKKLLAGSSKLRDRDGLSSNDDEGHRVVSAARTKQQ